jgi:hypothetical protein
MSDSVAIGSLAGTWVGAGVGLIALFGLLGPFLIWLASRTNRHKTLNAIGQDSHGYISRGWHLGPNIHLWQRVRVPLLRNTGPTRPFSKSVNWTLDRLKDVDTKATWISFGILLEAYGIAFDRGDGLVIDKERA